MIIQANDPRGRGSLLISMTSCRECTMPREMIDAPTCAYVCYVSEGREGLSSEKAGKVSETYPDPSALEDIFRGVGMDYQDMDLNINIDLLSLQNASAPGEPTASPAVRPRRCAGAPVRMSVRGRGPVGGAGLRGPP